MIDYGRNIGVTVVDDNALGIIIVLFFKLFDNVVHMRGIIHGINYFLILFDKLDSIETLQLRRN